MSTNSVSAPAWLIASTVAMNVCDDRDDGIALSDARGHQREAHGIGAVGYAHAVLRCRSNAANSGLEALDFRATDELRGSSALRNACDELLFELTVDRDEIQKRNGLFGHRGPWSAPSDIA